MSDYRWWRKSGKSPWDDLRNKPDSKGKPVSSGWANMSFLWDTSSQPTTSLQTAAYAASWGGITRSEDCAICPLLHAWAHISPQLASFVVIDRGEREYDIPPTQRAWAISVFWIPDHGWLWHCQDSNSRPLDDRVKAVAPLRSRIQYFTGI